MSIAVVRHARAGSRQRWTGADELRPLSKVGRAQAVAIARAQRRRTVTRIVSSPYLRCVQTVQPLAEKRKLEVETSDALAEGARLGQTLRLLEKLFDQGAVVCTHGDVLGNVLAHYAEIGVPLDGKKLDKACTWVLDVVAGDVVKARYEPPPTT